MEPSSIVVDPRRTYLASKADLWLQIRPGTDAALVLGLINLIIEQGLYDKDFVERWCVGSTSWRRGRQSIRWIAWPRSPGCRPRRSARRRELYATTKPAVLHHRVAMDQNLCSTRSSQAMIELVAITGNLDVQGGNLLPPRIPGYYRTGILSGGAVWHLHLRSRNGASGPKRFPLISSPRGQVLRRASR